MQFLVCLALVGFAASELVLGDKRDIVIGLPGGLYDGDLSEPATIEAVKQALGEFKRRASKSGRLGASDAIIVGDVVEVKTQVVAGRKYLITIKLGITSDAECTAQADSRLVSAKNCKDVASLGLHKFEVINQPWMAAKYQFVGFEDVEGPELQSLWKAGEN